MKRFLLLSLALMVALAACAPAAQTPAADALKVSNGTLEKTYTNADLKALGEAQATINGITYLGVPLTVLLADAGIDPAALSAVKAVAADGFSANYDAALYNLPDTIVAYAQADGPLSAEDGPFRMVLPKEGGKLNPRQLTEIIAIP